MRIDGKGCGAHGAGRALAVPRQDWSIGAKPNARGGQAHQASRSRLPSPERGASAGGGPPVCGAGAVGTGAGGGRGWPSLPQAQDLVVDRLAAGNRRMAEAAPGKDGLAATKPGNPGGLIGARLGVNLFRVDDLAQRRLAIAEQAGVAYLLAKVAAFIGVGL